MRSLISAAIAIMVIGVPALGQEQTLSGDTLVQVVDTTVIDSTGSFDSTGTSRIAGVEDIVEGARRIAHGSARIARTVADEVQRSVREAKYGSRETVTDSAVIRNEYPENHRMIDPPISVHKSRKQGYGGCLGYTPAVMVVNLAPINKLAQSDPLVSARRFPTLDDGYRAVMGSGMLGYGGVGDGIRIGGGGWSGQWREGSEKFGPNGTDSIAILQMTFKYGGFLVERAFVIDRLNLIAGSMLSFGSIEVKLLKTSATSAFLTVAETEQDRALTAKARFAGIELHGGFTYSFLPWMHIGADLQGLIAGSMRGFSGAGADPFLVTYPGVRLRLMLGNLG